MSDARLSPPLQETSDAIESAIQGMTDEQLQWHPDSKWSSAGILEHLSLAYGRTVERMRPVTQQDKLDVRKITFRERVGAFVVLKLQRIPPGRKSPEALCPKGTSPREVIASIKQNLSELDEVLKQCEVRFGDKRTVLVHTILGPLSVRDWRKFHYVHTLHHMRQIHALRDQMHMARSTAA
jgi:hypothetical protein